MAFDSNTLREFVDADAFLPIAPGPYPDDNGSIMLFEPQKPSSKFLVQGIPMNSSVLKGDSFYAVLLKCPDQAAPGNTNFKGKAFFLHGTKTGARADYILIDWQNRRIVFLELKNNVSSEDDMIRQLVGAEAVLDYIRHVGAKFKNVTDDKFLGADFTRFYVMVTHTDLKGRKGKTKIDLYSGSMTIDKPLRISHVNKVYFNKLCTLPQ